MKAVKGIVTTVTKVMEEKKYRIINRSQTDRTLLIEHPNRTNQQFKLVDTDKPMEDTPEVYRFQTAVKAGETKTFTVKEEKDVSASVALSNNTDDQIRYFVNLTEAGPALKQKLTEALQLKGTWDATQRELAQVVADLQRLNAGPGPDPEEPAGDAEGGGGVHHLPEEAVGPGEGDRHADGEAEEADDRGVRRPQEVRGLPRQHHRLTRWTVGHDPMTAGPRPRDSTRGRFRFRVVTCLRLGTLDVHVRRHPPPRRRRGRRPPGRRRPAPARLRRAAEARRRADGRGVARPHAPADRPGPRGVPPARRRRPTQTGGTAAATSSPPPPRPCAASSSRPPAASTAREARRRPSTASTSTPSIAGRPGPRRRPRSPWTRPSTRLAADEPRGGRAGQAPLLRRPDRRGGRRRPRHLAADRRPATGRTPGPGCVDAIRDEG